MSLSQGWTTQMSVVRFAAVGGLCFVLSASMLWVLVERQGWHHVPALVASILAGNVLGWLLNRRWTYARPQLQRNRAAARLAASEIVRYTLVNLSTMAVTVIIVHASVVALGWDYWWSSVGMAVVVAGANFVLHGRFTFAAHAYPKVDKESIGHNVDNDDCRGSNSA